MTHRPSGSGGDRLNVIVETPRGSRNKFKYLPDEGVFELGKQLPAGAVFPYDFGFIPATAAGDGDPLDVLVLLDAPTFPGCLVATRLIGVIEADQTGRSGRTVANPRLIAVAVKSEEHRETRKLSDLPEPLVDELVHFFVSYNEASGKTFTPRARKGSKRAWAIVRAGGRAAARSERDRRRNG
jgi:inorganic pyrophosphatase